jgi:hypothetical protein
VYRSIYVAIRRPNRQSLDGTRTQSVRNWDFQTIGAREVIGLPQFARYIGIDYSGAETAESSCKGLHVYVADGSGTPEQILLPKRPQQFWTRRGLTEWLCEELGADMPTIVGIDHGFSFPLAYFFVAHSVSAKVNEFSSPETQFC